MTVIDTAKDPYGRKYYAKKKRGEFEKLKRTKVFKDWRSKQQRIQKNKCAYCKVKLSRNNIVTHIDHIDPLYFEGTNSLDNLVLSCRRCNTKKWINNRYVKPDWVKQRTVDVGLQDTRREQKEQMKSLVAQELDERIAHDLQSWV